MIRSFDQQGVEGVDQLEFSIIFYRFYFDGFPKLVLHVSVVEVRHKAPDGHDDTVHEQYLKVTSRDPPWTAQIF